MQSVVDCGGSVLFFFVDYCLNANGMGKGVRPLLEYFFLAVAERLKGKVILPMIVIGNNRFCNLMIDIIKVLVLKLWLDNCSESF